MIDLRPMIDEIYSPCDLNNLNERKINWHLDSARIAFAVVVQSDQYKKDIRAALGWWYLGRIKTQDKMPLADLVYYRMQPNDGLGLIYRTALFLVLVYRQVLRNNIRGCLIV